MSVRSKVLITDLDNTLWDWFEIWYSGFAPFIEQVSSISGIRVEDLKKLIRPVHQLHGTSEYSFLLQSIPEIRAGMSAIELKNKYADAIKAYNVGQKSAMRLYDGVAEALLRIKGSGTHIVGYTDSLAFYTIRRMRKLGLDGVLDVLYSPVDHEIPQDVDIEEFRYFDQRLYRLERTKHLFTPRGKAKPSPKILSSIVEALGIRSADAVYVGDSLSRDIKMAQDAGILDIYAEYGHSHSRTEYKLLQEVSHWTESDVLKEQELKKHDVEPSIELKTGLADIFDFVTFRSYY